MLRVNKGYKKWENKTWDIKSGGGWGETWDIKKGGRKRWT